MAEQQRRSMRNLLINKRTQGVVIVLVILSGFAASVCNAVLYYIYVKESYDMIFSVTTVPQDLIDNRYSDLFYYGLMLLFISFVVTIFITVYALVITHRSAGACYRLHVVIEEIKSGKTDARVYLRKNDEYKDLAESFNEMIDSLT